MKLGILGGTFDPIHYGHIRMAIEVQEQLALEQILFVPTPSPHYKDAPTANFEQRCLMTREAIAPLNRCQMFELPNQKPFNFAVEALKKIQNDMQDIEQCLFVMGYDSFITLDQWHEWESLSEMCQFVVCSRRLTQHPSEVPASIIDKLGCMQNPNSLLSNQECPGWTQLEIPLLDISATDIRHAAQQKRQLYGLIPASVQIAIETFRLYE